MSRLFIDAAKKRVFRRFHTQKSILLASTLFSRCDDYASLAALHHLAATRHSEILFSKGLLDGPRNCGSDFVLENRHFYREQREPFAARQQQAPGEVLGASELGVDEAIDTFVGDDVVYGPGGLAGRRPVRATSRD